MIHDTAQIHPLACVEGARIGARTRVWQFASVIRGAQLGEDCNVASGACIDGSRLGDRCIVAHNVAMGPGFLFGSDCFIGPNVTLCNDALPSTDKAGFDYDLFDGVQFAIIAEDGVSIGAGAVIMPGVRLAKGAMVAAGAVCARDVPAGMIFLRSGNIAPVPRNVPRMRFVRRDVLEQAA